MNQILTLFVLSVSILFQANSFAYTNKTVTIQDSVSLDWLTRAEADKLGFEVKSSARISPTIWEKEKLGLLDKHKTILKSTFPSHLGRTSYYRFIIEEETYPDSASAKFRLDNLRIRPPKLSPDDWKNFPLRRGIQQSNRVIVVWTDVTAYKRKLEEMKNALEALSSTPDPEMRIQLLDSLESALRVIRR
jgi:hypothetical protein